jgi:hypothetical protein
MLVTAAIVGALGLASIALAASHASFHGSIGGNSSANLVFGGRFSDDGAPKSVDDFKWANVPTMCADGGANATTGEFKGSMRVDADGRFHGKGHPSGYRDATVKITGRFTNHNRRAAGTFRAHGFVPGGGCGSADTGPVDWDATKR